MVKYVKQGDIFGRIGSGIGSGLSEQLPEEIQRGRLASGLKQLGEKKDLTPFQQFAALSSIPGITPQMIQSGSELLRHQNLKNAYGNLPNQTGRQKSSADLSDVQESNFLDQLTNNAFQQGKIGSSGNMNPSSSPVENQQRTPNVRSEEKTPEIVNENPLNPNALTKLPWTPQQRNSRISDYMNQGFLADQAKDLASDDEARDLATPGALQARQKELTGKSEEARSELKRQLETKLQKTGEGVFKDITGEMLINAERGMERDLRTNPNASFKDVANDWSNRLLNVAKAKDQLNKMSETTGIESILKGDQTLKKLRSYQDIFKKSGNSEEYSKLLIEKFGLSPQGAATIAFPVNKEIKGYVDKLKPVNFAYSKSGPLPDLNKVQDNARKSAIEIEKYIDSDDSILSIARALTEKDPFFDQEAFFDQLEQDKSDIRLNDRQRREMAEGVKDIIPTWGDIKILPWFRRLTL